MTRLIVALLLFYLSAWLISCGGQQRRPVRLRRAGVGLLTVQTQRGERALIIRFEWGRL